MGGSHRGVSNGNNNRGKPYGLMLLLAFGAALLGVMLIHKLRERRIFNLLVKEKDQQLNSLHFLLQVSLSLPLMHVLAFSIKFLSCCLTTVNRNAFFTLNYGLVGRLESGAQF